MKKSVLRMMHILIVIFTFTSIVGCSTLETNPQTRHPSMKVGLLVEGNIFDQSWDSLAYQTLRKIERELLVEVDYYEFNGKISDEGIEKQTILMIERGFTIIFGHGAIFQDTFNRLGARYPDVSFIFFNGVAEGDNVFAANFTAESIGFFAGVGAALMSKSKIVGVVTAYPNQPELKGFEAGIRFINDTIQITTDAVGDWGNRERGRELAYALIEQGADVIIGFGDGFNIEVINAARESGIYAIGFLNDQSFIARDTVLYSVTQNVEGVYMDIVRLALVNQLQHVHFPQLDFHNGGQGITRFSEHVPLEVQFQIYHLLRRYKNGDFKDLL